MPILKMDRLATKGPSQWSSRLFLFVVVVICTNHSAMGRPLGEPIDDAMMYLMKYGYMDETDSSRSAALIHPDAIKESIMEFQRFAGLNETGEMDPETSRMMKLPRCGVKDMVGHSKSHGRSKRFALQGSRWRVKEITYRISSYPSKKMMSKSDVDSEIARALEVWSEFTDLKFVPRESGKVHIDIRFEEGRHGDGDPFDGQGGTLAHAFFPVFGGDAHFDDDEFWTKDSFVGTNLLQTAAHEFGHSLGLSHSDTKSALMSPFYQGFEKRVQLKKDDIEGIQQLYGEKTTSSKPSSTRPEASEPDPPSRVDDEELCNDASFDAIVTLKNGDTFTFKGGKYWKLTDESVANGYPRDLSSDWGGLPPNLDAAFTWTNGKTYFFKGSQYWRFTNQVMDSGYPKEISKGFEGIPDRVDGAFVWTGNEKIYFFKGNKYYRFDPEKKPPVSSSYPKPISNWEGIPNDIDDAIRYSNGFTYFFKDGQYWRFDDNTFKVDTADPPFPRSAGFWWFGCKSASQGRTTESTLIPRHDFGLDKPSNGDGDKRPGGDGSFMFKIKNFFRDVKSRIADSIRS